MENTVWVVLDLNLKVMDDTSLRGTYNTLASAMEASLQDVINKDGKNVKSHNFLMKDVEYTEKRISNGLSLGSKWGITYNSKYGNYPCCRMVIRQNVRV